MTETTATLETEQQDVISSQLVCEGVYFTRFDTFETDRELIFRCLMPGVQLIRVEPRLHKNELVIQGEVRLHQGPPSSQAGPKPTARFYRSFAIDQPVAADQVSAHLQDGMLTVRLPKTLGKQTGACIPRYR
jgi:HSP20 family molecular chaperone IbpA